MTSFYAGAAEIELHRTETANYATILSPAHRLLWVVLRPTEAQPPYDVTGRDGGPGGGEAFTEAGDDLVETVPMPDGIVEALEAFVAEHHVERPFFKRQRDRVTDSRPPRRRRRGRAMSDAENFVARWSRRKRETAKERRRPMRLDRASIR